LSVKWMAAVFELDLPSSHKLVLLVLADHADNDGRNAWPSVSLISKKTSLSERTVRASLVSLRDSKQISIEKGATWDRPNSYRLNFLTGANTAPLPGATIAPGANERIGGCNNRHSGVQPLHPNRPLTLEENRPKDTGVRETAPNIRQLYFQGKKLKITNEEHEVMSKAFEGADFSSEYLKMDSWLVTNRRNYRSFGRFANNWLDRIKIPMNGANGNGASKAIERDNRSADAIHKVLGGTGPIIAPIVRSLPTRTH